MSETAGHGEHHGPWMVPDEGRDDTAAAVAEIAELEDRWLRAAADLDNLRKRVARDTERARAEERARVAAEWLPVLDNLELALKHAGERGGTGGDLAAGAVIDAVRAVRDQAVGVLDRLGYARHDEAGVPFDPARHQAVATVSRPGHRPGTVVEVVRPGYGDGPDQLRPAVVVVAAEAPE
ncbi:molecular chaperone GrpE [Thermocatellispora tengchongensis]|uniref:Protein GrpE n=1 Tax=Thermocatellispora tengchongensis TaxID=1073253 RepID=A0A840NYS5_9ACTN|nr:nucleotide exchange factor GrpE [Thermocatellispora tengchongensis]MBB5131919.1 molecular chaperone GrpE [Thermocatellispora tengchongensis]